MKMLRSVYPYKRDSEGYSKKGNQECYVKAEMVVVRSQRLVVLDTDKENEEWGASLSIYDLKMNR